jgi:putative ABC transport system permease protein
MKTPRLPFIVRMVLRALASADVREGAEGDLLEMWARRDASTGTAHARARLVRDAMSLIGVLIRMRCRSLARASRALVTGAWTTGLGEDVRYAARLVRRQPAFSLAVVGTLALGIGTNAAIFSVVHGVLFKELPYEAGDRFVALYRTVATPQGRPFVFGFSSRDYLRLEQAQTALERLSAVTFNKLTLMENGEPENLATGFAAPGFFDLLGVKPAIGRTFRSDEYDVGHNAAVIISHSLWTRRFGRDPAITTRSIVLSGRTVRIVGVFSPDFRFVEPADVWVPLVFTPARLSNSGWADLDLYGRLKPSADIDSVSRSLAATERATASDPDSQATIRVEQVRTMLSRDVRSSLLLFWGAVALVLLIACANVANLLLARAAERRREIAIRRALGVDALRLVRQLLIESLLLSLAAGAAGLALTAWTTPLLVSISPTTIPRLTEIGIDPIVVAFTIALSLVTGLVFGVAPALQAARVDLTLALRDGDSASRSGVRVRRVPARSLILVTEVALSLVLLVGSGLLVRSFLRLQQIDTGFNADGVAAVTVSIPIRRVSDRTEALRFFEELSHRVASLDGVTSAGATSGLPLTPRGGRASLVLEGKPVVAAPPRDDPASGAPPMPPPPPPPKGKGQSQPVITPHADAIYTEVTAGYFETMGMRIPDGRSFTRDDRATSEPVVIVSEAMAKRYWPGERAIGRRLRVHDERWKTIVGIVNNVRRFALEGEALPEIYLPISQMLPETGDLPEHNVEASEMTIVARGRNASALLPSMRAQVYAMDRNQPVSQALTMSQLLATIQAPRRFNMIVVTAFGTAGTLLTAIGLYGVVAYLVAQRRREIGIRLALGAHHSHIVRLVVGEGLALVSIGLAIGLGASSVASRLIGGLLFGVQPADPVTMAAVVGLLLGVAVIATWMPARRAQSVDPVIVLRQE